MNAGIRNFLLILAAGLLSGALGCGFGALVATLSPEFAKECFFTEVENIVRYAAAVGMITGLFIGAGAMAFAMFVAAISSRSKSVEGEKENTEQ
ncbi:MAG: hypothetical protein GXP25_25610 [Planctomycetes bacterium]|nr:hypothetical protein [Planctomycetota bacterium]